MEWNQTGLSASDAPESHYERLRNCGKGSCGVAVFIADSMLRRAIMGNEVTETTNSQFNEPICTTVKCDYEKSMESRLGELGATIDLWCSKVDAAKTQATEKLEELNKKRVAAAMKLEEVKACSGEAWMEFKDGAERSLCEVKKAWEELKCGSEKAVAKFEKND